MGVTLQDVPLIIEAIIGFFIVIIFIFFLFLVFFSIILYVLISTLHAIIFDNKKDTDTSTNTSANTHASDRTSTGSEWTREDTKKVLSAAATAFKTYAEIKKSMEDKDTSTQKPLQRDKVEKTRPVDRTTDRKPLPREIPREHSRQIPRQREQITKQREIDPYNPGHDADVRDLIKDVEEDEL